MSEMRAKLKVSSVRQFEGSEVLHFSGVCKNHYDEDGLDEDNTYARYTPQVDFKITICNPALIGKFNVGDKYYIDFTAAPA